MGNVIQSIQQHIPERLRRTRERVNRLAYRPSGSTGYEQYPQDRYKVTHVHSGTQMEYHRSTQKYEIDNRGTQTEPTGSKCIPQQINFCSTTTIAYSHNNSNRGTYPHGAYPQPGYPQGGGYPQSPEYPSGGPYQQGYPQYSGQQAGYPPPQQGQWGGYPQQQGGYGGNPQQQGYGQPPNQMQGMANKAGLAACIACLTCFFCSCCPGIMGAGMGGDGGEGGGLDGSANVTSPADS
ncbi:hypothetical protein HF086_007747 [Spodoptera exigua]|uniref:Uncharacterized protein n=1 Tax=Spodoptera exigua TaxID=7107 RepID=A0A922SIT1_SPOEX|nr:hypothetical protein HF086_007747 [Spodoptera exigua]